MEKIIELLKQIIELLMKGFPSVEPVKPEAEFTHLYEPKFDTSLKMPTHGKYKNGFPAGLVLHFTAGRSLKGDSDAKGSIEWGTSQSYGFWCLSSSGTIFKTHELTDFGYHAGSSAWKQYGTVSDDFLGLETCCAGKVEKINDNKFKSWFGEYYTADQVRYISDPEWGEQGYYHKFTDAQEKAIVDLCVWLYKQNPKVFQIDNIVDHREVATPFGRKNDVGGSFSYRMKDFREYIKSLV